MLRLSAALAMCFFASASLAQEHPTDLLKESWIKAKWSQATKGAAFKRWDSWIPSLSGVGSAPVTMRDATGTSWTVAELCQPHDCADNKLVVIIDRRNQDLWGMQLTANPTTRRYFGNPGSEQKSLLEAAIRGSLAGAGGRGAGVTVDQDDGEVLLNSPPVEAAQASRPQVPLSEAPAQQHPTSLEPPAVEAASWRYGNHPLFGQSAHIDSEGESVGLACGFRGVDLMRSDAVVFRITRGLSPESTKPGRGIFFVEGQVSGGSTLFEAHPRGFLEVKENACGVVQAFQRGKSIAFAEGTFISLESRGKVVVTTLTQRGIKKEIGGDRDLHKLVDTKRIPLKGAAKAIRQMVNACPAIKADFKNDCGV